VSVRYLTYAEVIFAHRQVMLIEGQTSILISAEKLEAAVARPQTSVFGEDAYPTLAEKAAGLLESLAIGHPFIDGNKRIALAATDSFLALNGVVRLLDQDSVVELVLEVAAGKLKGIADTAERPRILYAPDLDER